MFDEHHDLQGEQFSDAGGDPSGYRAALESVKEKRSGRNIRRAILSDEDRMISRRRVLSDPDSLIISILWDELQAALRALSDIAEERVRAGASLMYANLSEEERADFEQRFVAGHMSKARCDLCEEEHNGCPDLPDCPERD